MKYRTHKSQKAAMCLTVLAAAVSSVSYASDLSDRFTINGFASVAGTWSPDKGEAGTSTSYAGITNDFNTQNDTKAAVQMRFAIDEKTSFTSQLIGMAEDGFTPKMEWAYLSYQVDPQLMVRAGRLRLPFYLTSETLDVGISYPWARPYEEVYGNTPISGYEGADVSYRFNVGDASLKANAYLGTGKAETASVTFRVQQAWGANIEGSLGDFSARAGYSEGKLVFQAVPGGSFDGLSEAFAAAQIANDPLNEVGGVAFASIGASYDNGTILVMGEMTDLKYQQAVFADPVSGYLTVGVHVGKFLPFVSYSAMYTKSGGDKRRADAVAALQGTASALSPLVAGLGSLNTAIQGASNAGATISTNLGGGVTVLNTAQALSAGAASAGLTDIVAALSPITASAGTTSASSVLAMIPVIQAAAAELQSGADGLNSAASAIGNETQSQRAYHVGLRYDVTPKVALKFEATHVFDLQNGQGNDVVGETGDNADFYTVKLDVMF